MRGNKGIADSAIVTAEEMRQIEGQLFAKGMPVAALMEKAASLVTESIKRQYPLPNTLRIGVLVGPGHNGGDALVVARELSLAGYQIIRYQPFERLKELTAQHGEYCDYLGISSLKTIESLENCDLIIDGLFGFGLERTLSGEVAKAVDQVNQWHQPTVSIDIPSGIHTDTGAVLGAAIQANRTYCLGLWKLAFFQNVALVYLGEVERLDFGIPESAITAVLSNSPQKQVITPIKARSALPLIRPLTTHKYQQGHLLLICGSYRYAGSAILAGLGARASGAGMLSIAVPKSIKSTLVGHLPEALILDCPETDNGAIANVSSLVADFFRYDAIACGPGLTLEAIAVVQSVLSASCPLLLDADALNLLTQLGTTAQLTQRQFPTVLTPHTGEFKRLFPDLTEQLSQNPLIAVGRAAKLAQSIVLLKGAKTAIAEPEGSLNIVEQSTPALARGGSGDVLSGLIGGLLAQRAKQNQSVLEAVTTGAWWHSHAGIFAANHKSQLGVDAFTLSQNLIPAIVENSLN